MLSDQLHLAYDYHRRGQWDAALHACRAILQEAPDHPDTLNFLGVLLHDRKQYREAADLFRRVADLQPGSASVLSNLAMVELAQGHAAAAHTAASRAVQLSPQHPQALYFCGQAAQALGGSDEAVQCFRNVLRVAPDFLPAQVALHRLAEPDVMEIRRYWSKLAESPQSASVWRDGLTNAIAAKLPKLIARQNYAQADVLRQIACRHQLGIPACNGLKARLEQHFRPSVFPSSAEGGRYLVIRSWGAGFWSDVDHVLSQLLLAEITGRQPLVHWGENCLYGGTASSDAFRYYFEPIGDAFATGAVKEGLSIYPPKWTRDNLSGAGFGVWDGASVRQSAQYLLSRPESVVVSDFFTQMSILADWIPDHHRLAGQSCDALYRFLIGKYLRPQPALLAESTRWVESMFGSQPYLAVHLRGLDKVSECGNLEQINSAVLSQADRVLQANPNLRVFGMTDDERLLVVLQHRYGDRLAHAEATRASGVQGIHFQTGKAIQRRLGDEVFLDSLIALRADAFVGFAGSNVGQMIGHLKPWQPGRLFLIGLRMQDVPNLMLNEW